MALFGSGVYAYNIKDYRDDTTHQFPRDSQASFKKKLAALTNDGIIQKYSVFESKLGGVPAPLMRLKMPQGKRFRHEYVELELKDAKGTTLFLSLEKGQSGILAQIGSNAQEVSSKRHSESSDKNDEREKANLLRSVVMTSIKHATTQHVPTITEFLDIEDFGGP